MNLEIKKGLKQLYPGIEFNVVQSHDFFHSTLYRVIPKVPNPEFPHGAILKKIKNIEVSDVQCEYFFLDSFYRLNKDPVVSSPKPLAVDSDIRVILMESVPGDTVKKYLLKLIPENINQITDYIDLSAKALSRFHSCFIQSTDTKIHIDSPLLNNFGKSEIKQYSEKLSECNIKTHVQAYIDFSPQNLIVNGGKVFLIDFPDRKCICSPHLDIARWKFNLLLFKQFPQFRFLKLNWWDESLLFERFIKKYCSEMNFCLNKNDIKMINSFVSEYAKKLLSIYLLSDGIQLKMECRYLNKFLNSLID